MEETIILYFSLSLLLISFAFKLHSSRVYKKDLPPSPPSLPILGHLHLLKSPMPMHRILHNLAQKYGPIIFLRFGSNPVVIVSSLAAVEECFTKNDIVLANRPKLLLGKHLGYNNTTLTLAPYGDYWRNLRRIGVIEIFSTHRINMFAGIRKDEIKRLIKKLSGDSLGDFSKVELKSVFRELTFNIMMRMVAGKRYYGDDVNEEEAKQFRETIGEAVAYAGVSNPGDFLPILNWIDGGNLEKKVKSLAKKTDKFLQGLIDEHRNKKADLESQNTMIDHLLSLQESQPEYYTDEIIKGLILVMLLAGTDTTAVTLEWAMSNLLNHPNSMKKTRDELDNQVGKECLLDESQLSKLYYLRNIVNETLRLYPAAPLLVPHVASEDCSIRGYRVPQGTIVLVNAWATHRDPVFWDDPTKFKPERFDNERGEAHKSMPFGLGRRSCPGSTLAQRVVTFTLASLIQCFEWKRVTDKEVDMTEARGLTMQKVKPLEAMCKACPIVDKI